MSNYKNTRGRSYAQQRRSSSGGILKTLGAVLVVFLAIGLIGSLFSRPSDSADADKKDPTTSVTKPSETAPKLITFSLIGDQYQALEGMTFGEWVDSDYNKRSDGTCSFKWNNENELIQFGSSLEVNLPDGSAPVTPEVVIAEGAEYNPL